MRLVKHGVVMLLFGLLVAPVTLYGQEKVLRIGTLDRGSSFDPARIFEMLAWEICQDNVFEGLVAIDGATGEIVPRLATHWSVSQDGTTWTFFLRKGVKFHDGTAFDAEAMKYSLQRAVHLNGPQGAILMADYIDADKIEVVDEYTIKIPFKFPYADALRLMATLGYSAVSPRAYPYDEFRPTDPVGTGPYKVTAWEKGTHIILERNENYWGPQPYFDKVIWRMFSKSSTLRFALLDRSIDAAWRTFLPEDLCYVLSQPHIDEAHGPGQLRYIGVSTKAAPFDNVYVRKAIAAAIDPVEVSEVVWEGTLPPIYSMIPDTFEAYHPYYKELYGGDKVGKAREFLTKAGFSESNPLKMQLVYTPIHYGETEADMAQLIKAQLERTNMIECELVPLEWASFLDRTNRPDIVGINSRGLGAVVNTYDWWIKVLLSKGGLEVMGSFYEDPELWDLAARQRRTFDEAKRLELIDQIQKRVADNVPMIPWAMALSRLVKWDDIRGATFGGGSLFRIADLYKEE